MRAMTELLGSYQTSALTVAESLWLIYHHETEAYDRTLPHVVSEHSGEAMPFPGEPRRRSDENAKAELARLRERALRLGVPRDELEKARRGFDDSGLGRFRDDPRVLADARATLAEAEGSCGNPACRLHGGERNGKPLSLYEGELRGLRRVMCPNCWAVEGVSIDELRELPPC